jgi:putative cell wall-binding protein
MTPSSTAPASPRPRRKSAPVLAAAAGMAMVAVVAPAPAGAATGWDPTTATVGWAPTTAVDGEISVTQVPAGVNDGLLKSFLPDGTPVTYATTFPSRDVTWGPAGDIVSGDPAAPSTVTGDTGTEALVTKDTVRGAQWSPYGDSLTRSVTSGASFRAAAAWTGSSTVEPIGPDLAVDPRGGGVFPNGSAMVIGVSTSPQRDLAILDGTSFPRMANSALLGPVGGPTALGYAALDAHDAAIGSRGTLAFVGIDATSAHLFVAEGGTPVAVADLAADCPGMRPAFAPSGTTIAYLKATDATCTRTQLRTLRQDPSSGSFSGGADGLVATSPAGSTFERPSWRPTTPAAEKVRLAGSDRIATGVAISQYGWGAKEAPVVVLANSANFPDAIVAGPLAGAWAAPLLLTPASTLDSRVLTEIKRVLDTSIGGVYIVGGPSVVSTTVEATLHNNGISTIRLAGSDRFRTSVAVADEIDGLYAGVTRHTVFLADGTNFPDALVSGPAATQFQAPVLLSNGTTVPTVVKTYVSSHAAITRVYSVGGSAAAAGSSAFGSKSTGLAGSDRYATSQKVAEAFFPGANVTGYASGLTFPDALTGGALLGGMLQPLMLVKTDSVPSSVATQAARYRASTDVALVFGGTTVVANGVLTSVGQAAGRQTALFGPDVPFVDLPSAAVGTAGTSSSTKDHGPADMRDQVSRPRPRAQRFG